MRRFAILACSLLLAGTSSAQQNDLAAHGAEVFDHLCAPCHGDGPGSDGATMLPGTYALHVKYGGSKPALLARRTDLPAEVIRTFLRNGVASMPPFRPTELPDSDIDAIAAFIRYSSSR
ncbi:MAG: cytochrome c [Gammaproteobacteria bacterium]|nr:cytochrome c [Gammaproteobacteria bacterium]